MGGMGRGGVGDGGVRGGGVRGVGVCGVWEGGDEVWGVMCRGEWWLCVSGCCYECGCGGGVFFFFCHGKCHGPS